MYDGERGSGPKGGADDLHIVSFEALRLNLSINNGSVRLSILGLGVKGARGVVQYYSPVRDQIVIPHYLDSKTSRVGRVIHRSHLWFWRFFAPAHLSVT